jgi:hypothetical protein
MKIHPLPLKSLFLAPLASVPVFTIAGLGSSGGTIDSEIWWGIVLSLVLVVPTSFLGMLFVGLPVFLFLRPYKYALLLSACALGLGVPFYLFFDEANLRMTSMAVAGGLTVSVTAYFLRPKNA